MVYGDKANLYATQFKTDSVGSIRATIGSGTVNWVVTGTIDRTDIVTPGDPLQVTLLGEDYYFNLNDNQMFYFVMIQDKEGERYIEKDN
jgi:hypothetical protein